MSVYRFVLVATLIPCLVRWARGQAGPIRIMDIALLLYCGWATLSIVQVHGADFAVQPSGILFIETMGAYLLARCYIRNSEDFENAIRLIAKLVVLLLPFAAYEWFTGNKPILTAFSAVLPTLEATYMPPRMGFSRVQGPFAHPIEFGLFCASIIALTHLVVGYHRSAASRALLTALVAVTTILSMSSAPIAAMTMQAALLLWNWLFKEFKHRWKFLWALAFMAYLIVEFGSNQTPIKFYISYFTFDGGTGWHRVWIWEFGSASVLNHPLFGIGFNDWERPRWLASSSVDNFWLVIAMRHGLPALIFMLAAYVGISFAVAFKGKLDDRLQTYRVAYLLCMAAYLFVGSTVHLWATAYVWFLFLLGSGVWLLDVKAGDEGVAEDAGSPKRKAAPRLPNARRPNVPAVRSHPHGRARIKETL